MVTYFKARTLAEALDALGQDDVEGRVLLGGTDLLVGLRGRLGDPPRVLVDLKEVKDLGDPVAESEAGLRIGPTLTMAELASHPVVGRWFPALAEAAVEVGSVAIRNRATLVGNICNASPASDTAPPLLVHGASVQIASRAGQRTVPISSFFLSPRVTACGRGEVVIAVELPRPEPGTGSAYRRLTRRWGVDLITVGVAAAVHGDGRALLGLGAVGPTPLLVELPAGIDLEDPAALADAVEEATVVATPISDIRAGADYRAAMLKELASRAVRAALESTRRTGDGSAIHS